MSCVSALHVTAAVDSRRYELRLIGITTDGAWVDTTAAALSCAGSGTAEALPSPDEVRCARPEAAASDALAAVRSAASPSIGGGTAPTVPTGPIDSSADTSTAAGRSVVVLPLLHGPMGEDGTVQGLLELAGIPYCGAGVAGSATAMDKGLAKALMTSVGLPQARYLYRRETQFDAGLEDAVERELGWPVFVKPANMGSSIGISKVKDPGGLAAALELATRYDTAVVIEEAVPDARELEMGVLGWPELRTSVPGEIKPSRDFYDFEDKYVEGAAGLEIPARLPDGVADQMSRLALEACEALRVDSMARVDFFYTPDRGLLINEVNTIPGFTPISMYPQMWAASGVSYSRLIDVLVGQALARAARRRSFRTGR